MIDQSYLRVLRKLHSRLAEANSNWTLTGSLSFALQGVPVEPHDIDLQTDAAGAYEIERLFGECVTQPVTFSSAERIRSHFGALRVDGVKVEIMGDVQKRLEDGSWEAPVDIRLYRRAIDVEGMAVPVLSLEYEYQAYLKLGRAERAGLLKRYL